MSLPEPDFAFQELEAETMVQVALFFGSRVAGFRAKRPTETANRVLSDTTFNMQLLFETMAVIKVLGSICLP